MALTPETLSLFVEFVRLNPTIPADSPVMARTLLAYVALNEGDQRQVDEYRLRGTQIEAVESIGERHQRHYQTCNCLGDTAICCDPACPCKVQLIDGSLSTIESTDE